MCQRRWLELIKDYDLEILYHPGKANVVADAVSRKRNYSLAVLFTDQKPLLEDMRRLELEIVTEELKARIANLSLQPTLLERIKNDQQESEDAKKLVEAIKGGNRKELWLDDAGIVRFGNRFWVPSTSGLRKEIMDEAHASAYTIHPGSTKMYKDLKKYYWWDGMKRDVAEHVAKCLICQQVKAEHQRPTGELQ